MEASISHCGQNRSYHIPNYSWKMAGT